MNDDERDVENIDYINVKGRYNSVISIKNDRSCKNDDNKNFGGGDYRGVRGSLCTATPPSVIANRTPPPPSQKHLFLKNIKSIFA